jgi:hypothetical protein
MKRMFTLKTIAQLFFEPPSRLPVLLWILMMVIAGSAAHAQLGSGWVEYSPTKKVHLDNEAGLQIYNWTPYKSVCSPTICADYTYDSGTDEETFRLFDGRTNRSEIRLLNDYSQGSRQFEGYVTFYAPLDDESLMQIFGSTEGATQVMIRGYAANGGSMRGAGKTLATNVYGKEVKVNVIHLQEDVGNMIQIYINDVKMAEIPDNEAVSNYHKYGNYGTLRTDEAVVKWRRVRSFRDGYAPGTTPPPAPTTNPFDLTDNGGTITAQYSNTSKPAENYPSLIDNTHTTKYYQSGRKALWVQYRSTVPAIVTRYTITSANDVPDRDPRDWNLAGSNDGVNWTVLDSRTGQSFSSRFLKKTYSFENTFSFTYYRLNITANNGNTGTQFAEWELFQRKNQEISFGAIPEKTFGDEPFEISANSSSELPVDIEIVSGPATISDGVLTITGAGLVTLRASQQGNENYFPAAAEQSFVVNKAPQTLSFAAMAPKNKNEVVTLSAVSSAGLPVVYSITSGPGSVSGNNLSFTGEGTVTVEASQPGNENYLAAAPVSQTILVYGEDAKKDGIKIQVYPNPTHGIFKVKLENKNEGQPYTFIVFDDRGNPVALEIIPKGAKKYDVDFNLGASQSGIYYLHVSDGVQTYVRVIIKQ